MQVVSQSRLGAGSIIFEQLLRPQPRADYGESLAPIVAAKDADNLALLVVNRTARKAVARANLYRPVVDALQAIGAIERAVADHLVAVRPGNQHQLFVLV